jgi:hypothetical protein
LHNVWRLQGVGGTIHLRFTKRVVTFSRFPGLLGKSLRSNLRRNSR